MKIINLDIYRDGGTISVKTDEGEFCFYRGAPRETNNYLDRIFIGYPYPNKENLIKNEKVIASQIYEALQEFEGNNCTIEKFRQSQKEHGLKLKIILEELIKTKYL